MESSLSINMRRRIKGTRKKKSELGRAEWGKKFETAEATQFTHAQILRAKGTITII